MTDTKIRVIFKTITKRFKTYEDASRFLTGLRFKFDENTFDPREYRKDQPLGFQNLSEQWLKLKKETVKPRSYNNLHNYIKKASGK